MNLIFLAFGSMVAIYLVKGSIVRRAASPQLSENATISTPSSKKATEIPLTAEGEKHLLSPQEVKRILNDQKRGITVLDVRDREKFGRGHIPSSINIPLDELEARVEEEVPQSQSLILAYCDCDGDDNIALAFRSTLISWGYKDVIVLKGGVDGWQRASFDLVTQRK